jgi:predicted DNA-binding protein YlxM (UPF0122 family)
MISKLPTQGLPVEIRTPYFHLLWGKDEGIITQLSSRQQYVLKLYYGLLGEAPLRVKEIQENLGIKNHSLIRSLCLQAFTALHRQKKKAVCNQLGITTKEIPRELRSAYFQSMYSNLDLSDGYEKIPTKTRNIFQTYYVEPPYLSTEELAFRYQLTPTSVLRWINRAEDVLVALAQAKLATTMYQEWVEKTQRYCPKCYSTNVTPLYFKGRRNGLRCFECHKPVSINSFGSIRLA